MWIPGGAGGKVRGAMNAIQQLRDVSVWRKVGPQQARLKMKCCLTADDDVCSFLLITLITSHPSASLGNLQEASRPHRQSGWREVRPGEQSGEGEQRGTLQNSADNQNDSLHPSVFYRADFCSVDWAQQLMLYVRLIVLVRLSNIYWFHPLKCEDLLLSSVSYDTPRWWCHQTASFCHCFVWESLQLRCQTVCLT